MKLVDLKITLSFPSFFHVCGHVSKFFFSLKKKKKNFSTCLLSLPTAICAKSVTTTKFIMSLTYFMLKINIEFEKNIDVQEF